MNEIVNEEDGVKIQKVSMVITIRRINGIDILFIDRILAHNKLWKRSISFNNTHFHVFNIINDFKLRKNQMEVSEYRKF